MGFGEYSDTQASPILDPKLWEGSQNPGTMGVKEESKEGSIKMN